MLDEKNYDDDFMDEMELDKDDEFDRDDELDKDDEYDSDKDKEPLSGNDIKNQDDFEVWSEFFQ